MSLSFLFRIAILYLAALSFYLAIRLFLWIVRHELRIARIFFLFCGWNRLPQFQAKHSQTEICDAWNTKIVDILFKATTKKCCYTFWLSEVNWRCVRRCRCSRSPQWSPPLTNCSLGLHNEDVENINAITEVIHQQPPVNVLRRLVRESAAHRDQPNIPVPRERHKEQPHHVGQVCEESERISRPTVFSMHAIIQHIWIFFPAILSALNYKSCFESHFTSISTLHLI